MNATELQLLQLLARGKIVKAIAAEMHLTPGTAKACLTRIYKKLGVHTSTAAVAWYIEHQSRAPRRRGDGGRSYRQALVAGEFAKATQQWSALPPDARPAEARVYVCVMYLLQDMDTLALDQANVLTGREASLVFVLHQWLSGNEDALPMVRNLLASMPSGARAKHAGLLALYFGGLKKNLANVAAAAAHALVVELEDEVV
ncbi:MAG: LuxR C-terminal-related transcriptional regulator [Usitatibacteraceae bacterium]